MVVPEYETHTHKDRNGGGICLDDPNSPRTGSHNNSIVEANAKNGVERRTPSQRGHRNDTDVANKTLSQRLYRSDTAMSDISERPRSLVELLPNRQHTKAEGRYD